jgi:nucleoside-diphosphate-sugar epimerase
MSLSFTLTSASPVLTSSGTRRRVLITGAAGRIGASFSEHAAHKYDLRLMVRGDEKEIDVIRPFGEVTTANLSDLPRLKEICRDIDTVVHLAASPDPSAVWKALLDDNIIGTYHIMAAAKSAGVRRVIYASSVHAVGGYPPGVQVKTTEPVNPGDLYGVSKCFGEALGRYMAEQEALSVIALRIGAVQPRENMQREDGVALAEMFVSPRDLNQLIEKCIDVPNIRWGLFHAISDNRFKRLDITDARELLGYQPQDDFADLFPKFRDLKLNDTLQNANLRDRVQQSGMREELS